MDILGQEFGFEFLRPEGGGIVNGSFLKPSLIDDLSLLIYPGIDGLSGVPAIFEYRDGRASADWRLILSGTKSSLSCASLKALKPCFFPQTLFPGLINDVPRGWGVVTRKINEALPLGPFKKPFQIGKFVDDGWRSEILLTKMRVCKLFLMTLRPHRCRRTAGMRRRKWKTPLGALTRQCGMRIGNLIVPDESSLQ